MPIKLINIHAKMDQIHLLV